MIEFHKVGVFFYNKLSLSHTHIWTLQQSIYRKVLERRPNSTYVLKLDKNKAEQSMATTMLEPPAEGRKGVEDTCT
jgi:hypothetical protein